MKIPKIAVVIAGNKLESFLKKMDRIQQEADLVELRVDSIRNLKVKDIEKIKQKAGKTAIFTCRKKSEGGYFSGTERERIDILRKAVDLKFSFVDIELSTLRKYKIKKNKNTKLIVSYHNFKKTPHSLFLEKIVNEAYELGTDVVKIAVMVKRFEDNKNILALVLNKQPEQEIIALGMGAKGRITRVLSPLLGGYLTFSSYEKNFFPDLTSPRKLEKIYQKLRDY